MKQMPALWMAMIETPKSWRTLQISRESQELYATQAEAHRGGPQGNVCRRDRPDGSTMRS